MPMTEEAEAAAQERRTWTRAGLGMIAFGLISAIGIYLLERRSSDFVREQNAMEFAFLYTALWVVLGLIVIRWFNRNAPDNTTEHAPHAPPPTTRANSGIHRRVNRHRTHPYRLRLFLQRHHRRIR